MREHFSSVLATGVAAAVECLLLPYALTFVALFAACLAWCVAWVLIHATLTSLARSRAFRKVSARW